jgi:hypothetical protein
MTLVQKEIKRVTIRPNGTEKQIRPVIPPYLCFTANTANSTVSLNSTWSPTAITLETSPDGSTWSDYTIWTSKTLSAIWDKIYFRNKSTTTTEFNTSSSSYYYFSMTWSINASWDVTSLINKDLTTSLPNNYCFHALFLGCTSLVTSPKLLATTLTQRCYMSMFQQCTNLEVLPQLPTTWTLPAYCYYRMFYKCSKIKLSTSQTWEYQTEYRIPTTWTWTAWNYSLGDMFAQTWWTFTWNPTINTTYYTSNTIVW